MQWRSKPKRGSNATTNTLCCQLPCNFNSRGGSKLRYEGMGLGALPPSYTQAQQQGMARLPLAPARPARPPLACGIARKHAPSLLIPFCARVLFRQDALYVYRCGASAKLGKLLTRG